MGADAGTWIAGAGLFFAVAKILYDFVFSGQKATKTEVDDHDIRLTKLEARVDGLPTKDAFHQLELSVSKMEGGMAVLHEQLKPVVAGLARIEKYMIDTTTTARKTSK